jgi:hypothetical protein
LDQVSRFDGEGVRMGRECRSLQRQNQNLKREVAALQRRLAHLGGGLQGMLARRSMKAHRRVPAERFLVLPSMTDAQIDRFYRLLHRYSFRLLVRDVIRLRSAFSPEDLTAYCSARAARGYLTSLQGLGLVERGPTGGWHLVRRSVTSFGETLEWYVAEIFKREFLAEAVHSISFRALPPGGDFDVLAAMEGILVHVEVKSSPPRGIEAEEVRGFLQRRHSAAPHLALFLVDTHLRMRDKIAPIFDACLGGTPLESEGPLRKVQRLKNEIFQVGHRLYILNASRGILSNLKTCIGDFLRNGNPATTVEEPDYLESGDRS